MAKRKKWTKVDWEESSELKNRVIKLVRLLDMDWIDTERLFFVRSSNSSSRAYARIWGLSKIWQITLKQKPSYVIEVLSQRFDKLRHHEQDKVLLHELAHIPKNFSGSLLPHVRKRGKRNFHDRVNELFKQYKKRLP
jgi:predicted metallopeptidase